MRSPKVPWWPGSVKTGGIHVHHLVFGIVLLMLAGFSGFALQPDSPWLEILAAAFGVGMGLTLDEFALWLHLDDVYWAEEGRQSVDAVVFATCWAARWCSASPRSRAVTPARSSGSRPFSFSTSALAIAALKGKYVSAVIGILVPLVSLVAAIRLAKPGSPWARRRYPEGSEKLGRATARYERSRERYRRWQDRIGGAPTPAEPPKPGLRARLSPPRAPDVRQRLLATRGRSRDRRGQLVANVPQVDDLLLHRDPAAACHKPA